MAVHGIDGRLVLSCFLLWCYFFGFCLLSVEATHPFMGFTLVSLPIATVLLIKFLAVPPPQEEVVTRILGSPLEQSTKLVLPTVNQGKEEGNTKSSTPSDEGAEYFGLWAHRFAGLDAPENTLEALKNCIKNGARAVEFDVILTKDMVPVVFHDYWLQRITNLDADIRTLSFDEVSNLNVSVNHPYQNLFPDTRIPHLEQVVTICVEHQIRMLIDIKDDRPEMVTVICELYNKYSQMYKLAMVSSFNPFIIFNIRKRNPSIAGALTWRPFYMSYGRYSPTDQHLYTPYYNNPLLYYFSRLMDFVHTYYFNHLAHAIVGASAVLIDKDNITTETVQSWKKRGVRVIAWTVNAPLHKQYFVRTLGTPVISDTVLCGSDLDL